MTERFDLSKYELTFSDEFDGLSLFDGSSGLWKPEHYWGSRNLGNGEQQFYVDPAYKNLGLDPFSMGDGVLTIRAEKASAAIKPLIENMNYTSGMISSEQSFSQQYGYFEIRAEMPAGKGLWPAFWLLTADGEWPPEYDVVEVLGHEPDRLYATSHYNDASGVHRLDHAASVKGLFDSSDGFHTYGFDWQPDTITWYYDGIKVGEAANRVTDQPMYLIANLTVGGGWPGSPDGSTDFPADMKIDYIRAYQKQSDHAAAAIPTGWAPIGVADFTVTGKDGAVVTWNWKYEMPDGVAKVQLTGDWSRYAVGNDADNYIAASGAPYNQLDGGKGDDTLVGSKGMDLFVLKDGNGNDVILNFANSPGNTDKVRLEGFHFRHFDDVEPWMSEIGDDVVLRLDEDQAVLFKDKRIADFSQEQFVFTDPVAPPVTAPAPTPVPGTGTTTIVVRAAADSWQGDPVFKLLVDGEQVGADTAVSVQKSSGGWQDIAFEVELPADASQVAVEYINDKWGGTSDTDRNLHVEQVTIGGVAIKAADPVLLRNGAVSFDVPEPGVPTVPGPDAPQTVTLRVAGDAWNGDPLLRLLVDGEQVGADTAVTARYGSGWQELTFDLPAGGELDRFAVQFLNDRYEGKGMDRNLYLDRVKVGGVTLEPEDAWYARDKLADMDGREKMSWSGTLIFETEHVTDWSVAA
ncbi:MAG TPA: carbohydrate-binding domain-containing protein [Arenibaculum sp.]|nr:carbohydrate-binding domain-containing protein [Arenibaculum sp.]